MNSDISEAKRSLRAEMMRLRREMPSEGRHAADEKIAEHVLSLPAFQAAETVFAYVSMPHEVATRALLAEILNLGKALALPVCLPETHTMRFYRIDSLRELKSGLYRIPVPPVEEARLLTPDEHTLMLVPTLAFDAAGYRLGAGGGYYDRYFAAHSVHAAGICYAQCRQEEIPHGMYDRRLNCCVTELKQEEVFYG